MEGLRLLQAGGDIIVFVLLWLFWRLDKRITKLEVLMIYIVKNGSAPCRPSDVIDQ